MGCARRRRGGSLVVVCALALAGCPGGPEPTPVLPDPGTNVILLTLDGTRAQELFGMPDASRAGGDDQPVFPQLHEALARSGVIYGDLTAFDEMTTTNNTGRSLPGYMSIFTGYEQPCYDNDCPQVRIETVLEYVQRLRGFAYGQVAVFASWQKLGRALEQVVGRVRIDMGPQPDTTADCIFNQAARLDRCTWALAMRYLDEQRPRLLYISLLDADSWGHRRDYREYLAGLRRYDGWIAELRRHLRDDLGDYGARTTVLITDDHGRGHGDNWFEHNTGLAGSDQVFLAAFGRHVHHGRVVDEAQHTSADVRPTIEVLFGLPASACVRCGQPLAEVIGDLEVDYAAVPYVELADPPPGAGARTAPPAEDLCGLDAEGDR